MHGKGRIHRTGLHQPTAGRIVAALATVVAVVVAGYAAVALGVIDVRVRDGGAPAASDGDAASSSSSSSDSEKQIRDAQDPDAQNTPGSDASGAAATASPTPQPVLEAYDPEDAPSPAGVEAVLDEMLASDALGNRVGAAVYDVATGEQLYGRAADEGHIPASTTKLLTSVAVLDALGPGHRFETAVVYGEPQPTDGDVPVPIVLVGGGDPVLASERALDTGMEIYPPRVTIEELARRTAEQLKAAGIAAVNLGFDDTLFEEEESPAWEEQYIPTGVVAPVSALWVDQARLSWPSTLPRAEDPAQDAANRFAQALTEQEISVEGEPERAAAPAGAEKIARVLSAPLGEIVEYLLLTSNNETAEVLGRHVAVAEGEPATFAGMITAMTRVLDRLGVDLAGNHLDDASGLARSNRLSPNLLIDVLLTAADPANPHLRATLTGLPIAGFTGSLDWRFVYTGAEGAGYVRGKTGTLTGVSTLAGLVTTADGDLLAYAVMADDVVNSDPRPAIDAAVAALAGCGCR